MFPDRFHLKLVASAYGIDYRSAIDKARQLGIQGFYVTDEQAFDIANYEEKPIVEVIVVYNTIEVFHSRLNNTALEDL